MWRDEKGKAVRQAWLWTWVVWSVTATMGAAEDALIPLDTREAAKDWAAVGRLDIDGAGFCTATLVRDDLILTAAHCVFDRNQDPIAIERFHFQAGLRNGRALATRGVRQIYAHPAYLGDMADWPYDTLAADIALIVLDQPIRFTGIETPPLSPDIYAGDQVASVSYGASRAEAPSLQPDCTLQTKTNGSFVTDCLAEQGTSGAPLFRQGGGRPRLVAIIAAVAEQNGTAVSLAVPVRAQLPRLLATLVDVSEPKLTGADTPRNDTGAKFIRP